MTMAAISALVGGDVVVRKTTDSTATGFGGASVRRAVSSPQVGAPDVIFKMFRGRTRARQQQPQLWPRGGH